MSVNIKKWVQKMLSLSGFSVQADAVSYLASQLEPLDDSMRKKWIEKITSTLQTINTDSAIVNRGHIEQCLEESTKKHSNKESIFNIINAFDVPCITYDNDKKKFSKDSSLKSLFPETSKKSQMFRRRYDILLKRTLDNKMFKIDGFGDSNATKIVLKNAEWFLCSSEKIKNAAMLGILVHRADRLYELEDTTGSIKLDLSNCKFEEGFFVEHSFVIVKGVYDDKTMQVKSMQQPPGQTAVESSLVFGNVNTFGGNSETSLRKSAALLAIQEKNKGAHLVFLSDVWLDDVWVLKRLKTLFTGYSNYPPVTFVLMGNFASAETGAAYSGKLKLGFRNLTSLLAEFPLICEKSHFVFVPGPSDPGSPSIYPRGPIPVGLIGELKQKIKNLTLATNPCRIQYCTREIIVFREDLLTKLCRNVISFPEDENLPKQFAKTLIAQGSLTPVALHVCPVFWNYSHCMDLYPPPNLIVVGDQFSSFSAESENCVVTNPGSLKKSNFTFQTYNPFENKVDESHIPDNDDM